MTAYAELSTPHQMSQDCLAASEQLRPAVTAEAPGIRYEDRPREVSKPVIEISDAAAALSRALGLHLD